MNNSNINKAYNESTKENFVVMYNNFNFSKESKVDINKVQKKSREIVEYTDDVADQVRSLYDKITTNLEEYFQGKNKINDVNNRIKQSYKSIKNYCIVSGQMNENNEAYKSKIIKDIYRGYRHNAVIAAVNVNNIEGSKLARKIAGSEKIYDEHIVYYYNSDYYFACEILRDALIDMANKLAIEEKIKEFDTQSIDNRKRYVYDYGFNHAWSWNNKMNLESVINIDKNLVPPEKIKAFYMEYLDSNEIGKLLISYDDNDVVVDLHTNYTFANENCNLHDILKSKNIQLVENPNLNEFFNSFYVSTKDFYE